jgi:putative hydrolase of the HAD superfamily
MTLRLIAFDADDTLWRTNAQFDVTERKFRELLAPWAEADHLAERLIECEQRNLRRYGYGVKGFALSMIETAVEVTEARAPASIIGEILAMAHEMLDHPIEQLPGAQATLEALADRYELVLITKGDLLHQEQKLARSGLGELFAAVDIVSEKTADTYRRVFRRHGVEPHEAAMVGDSVRSDILPAIEAGAFGVHVPSRDVWIHEAAEPPAGSPRYARLEAIGELVDWVESLAAGEGVAGAAAVPT